VSPEIDGLWTDDATVDERRVDQPAADAIANARAKADGRAYFSAALHLSISERSRTWALRRES